MNSIKQFFHKLNSARDSNIIIAAPGNYFMSSLTLKNTNHDRSMSPPKHIEGSKNYTKFRQQKKERYIPLPMMEKGLKDLSKITF